MYDRKFLVLWGPMMMMEHTKPATIEPLESWQFISGCMREVTERLESDLPGE